jgi:glycosyltransferase involved in cell wall biosynthesis
MHEPMPPLIVDRRTDRRRSLRIALVTETYPPEVNGVAMTLRHVVEGLRARGHDVQLVRPRQNADETTGPTGEATDVLLRGMPIPRYPDLRMGLPARQTLVSLWGRRRPDLVHVATEGPLGWSAVQAARQLRLPVCSDFRTNFHAYSRFYGIGWLHRPIMAYLRTFHNRTALTMVPTEALRHDLGHQGFERLSVVSRGVDTDLFNPARRSHELRRQWQAAPEAPVVLFVGRLAQEKNLATLAEAFAAMRRLRPDARMVVVGDGPKRQELQALLPDAVFAGTRRGVELARHYASADVFLFPSMTETFGNVTTEAMASGLAVVAFEHAAAGLLIRSGSNGLLAPLADKAAFIAQATRLATDAALIDSLRAGAAETANRLGWGRIVDQIQAAFIAAVSSEAAAPEQFIDGPLDAADRQAAPLA